MRQSLTDAQRDAVMRIRLCGLAPCVISSDGRVLPIARSPKKPWVEPTVTELVLKETL